MKGLLDSLDHPLPFVFFLTLAIAGMLSFGTFFAKRSGSPGLASLLQHP